MTGKKPRCPLGNKWEIGLRRRSHRTPHSKERDLLELWFAHELTALVNAHLWAEDMSARPYSPTPGRATGSWASTTGSGCCADLSFPKSFLQTLFPHLKYIFQMSPLTPRGQPVKVLSGILSSLESTRPILDLWIWNPRHILWPHLHLHHLPQTQSKCSPLFSFCKQ